MRRWILISLGIATLAFTSAALGVFTGAELYAGDGTYPKLRAWNFENLTGSPPLFVSQTATEDNYHGSAFYTLIPEGEEVFTASLGTAIRQEGSGAAVAHTAYAENEGHGGPVWGMNSIAVTYNDNPAVGMEVNGFNYSDGFQLVRGIDIVNGGTAPTQYALGIMTSGAQPAGKPRFGIVLGGPEFASYVTETPASRTGILINHIDSGEAIQVAAGDFITLDGERGQIRMRYNPDTNQIEFYNGDALKYAIPM